MFCEMKCVEPRPSNSIENEWSFEDEVQVFPNPFKEDLHIESSFQKAQNYALYSILGKHIMNGPIQSDSTLVNLSATPDGVYILKVGDQTFKVIKRK